MIPLVYCMVTFRVFSLTSRAFHRIFTSTNLINHKTAIKFNLNNYIESEFHLNPSVSVKFNDFLDNDEVEFILLVDISVRRIEQDLVKLDFPSMKAFKQKLLSSSQVL